MGTLQALEAIKLLSGIETLRENSDCSTVSRASGAAWLCPRQWLPGMRRKQCRSCLTINDAVHRRTNCSRAAGATRPTKAGAALAINQQIVPRDQWAQISCRMATRSCFFRLLQGVEIYVLRTKRLIHICLPAQGNSLFTTDGGGDPCFRQPAGDAGMKRVDLRQNNDAILEPLIAAV